MDQRKRGWGGIEVPALQRFFDSMISANCGMVIFRVPTSTRVPTTARTMLRKNLSAEMVNCHAVGESATGDH